jgi:nucleolar protein 14
MPETSAQLDATVRGLTAAETATVLNRVRVLHAPSLKEENRKKTQTFLGLLLKKFETLAGETPLPVTFLDAVSSAVAATAATVPFFAAAAARARLEKMASRLKSSLRSGETGWPPARTFLLLALFADIFPTTDKSTPGDDAGGAVPRETFWRTARCARAAKPSPRWWRRRSRRRTPRPRGACSRKPYRCSPA